MVRSVNYFENFGVMYHLLKIECNEFSFTKSQGCRCNLPFNFIIIMKCIMRTRVQVSFTFLIWKIFFLLDNLIVERESIWTLNIFVENTRKCQLNGENLIFDKSNIKMRV
jgi:hypothetical protein